MAPLTEDEQREFDRICQETAKIGCLCKADSWSLTVFIKTWTRWRGAQRDIEEGGTVAIDGKGRESKRPCVMVAEAAERELRLAAGTLGINPHIRKTLSLQVKEAAAASKLEMFIS